MEGEPRIPFGAKRVFGQLQKGDAIWNGERWAKVKKVYPSTEGVALFAIRKCEVIQTDIPGMEDPPIKTLIKAHQYLYYVKSAPVISDYDYDCLCKRHNIEGGGGSDRACDYGAQEIALAQRLLEAAQVLPLDE